MKQFRKTTLAAALGVSLVLGALSPAPKALAADGEVSVIFDYNGVSDENGNTEFRLTGLLEGEALGGNDPIMPDAPNKLFLGWSTDPSGSALIDDPYEFYPSDEQRIYAVWQESCVVTLLAGEGGSFDAESNSYWSDNETLIQPISQKAEAYTYNVAKGGRFGLSRFDGLTNQNGFLLTGWKGEDGRIYQNEAAVINSDATFTPQWGEASPVNGQPFTTSLVFPWRSTADISFSLADPGAAGGNEILSVGSLTELQENGNGVTKELFYWRDHPGGIYRRSPDGNGLIKEVLENPSDDVVGYLLRINYPVKELKYDLTERTDVYRLYNPNTGEHFYTSSQGEYNQLGTVGWQQENIGFMTPGFTANPIYRVYNPNAGDHHYTTNYGEVQSLVGVGWSYEGILAYGGPEVNTPVYRLYNPNAVAGAHHFTTDAGERDYLMGIGWQYEDVAWYGADYYESDTL